VRVSIFITDSDISAANRKKVTDNLQLTADGATVEITWLTSYPWGGQGPEPNDPYAVTAGLGLKFRLCRKLLQAMNYTQWIPPFLGFLAVRLCAREIQEGLLGSDPDVIVCLDPQWARTLKSMVRKAYPQWVCIGPMDCLSLVDRQWRRYDRSAKVSIVLPTYNGSKYIRRSIESCLNQTHDNLELLVVDDGSNEEIKRIIESYSDSRLRYLRHQTNLGLSIALNTGFKNSTGRYLTWTSDDNYYANNAIEEMVRFLRTYPDIDFVYADTYIIDEKDSNPKRKIRRSRPPAWLKVDNGVGGCFLYKRKVYETIGEYNYLTFLAEDYDYWVRVSKIFRMQRLFRPLYYYRNHAGSLTAKYRREKVVEKVRLVKQMNRV